MTPKELKNSILQLAIEGKLVEQRKEEGSAENLYAEIQKEKQKLIKQGKIKKEKELPEITEDEIPFEIPKSWKWVRLGNIGSWGSGATPSKNESKYYKNGDIPWLLTGDLNDSYINNSPQYITKLALEKTSVKLNPKGSILIAMYGATIGKLGILNIEATTNQACCACQTIKGVYNKYLFYFLMAYKKRFTEKAEGGAQPNISKEKIVSTQFSLPPLNEQKRIVEKIEELMPLVDRYEVLYNRLNELNKEFPKKLKNAVLQKAIEGKLVPQIKSEGGAEELYKEIQKEKQKLIKQGKIKKEKELPEITEDEISFEIPKGWKLIKLNELCDIINGFTPLRTNEKFWKNGDIPWFTVDDIRNQGRIINYTNQKITKAALSKDSNRLLPKGTVLLCCTASVGEYAISKIPLTTNQQFNGLVIKDYWKKYFSSEFLLLLVQTFKDRLINVAGKTTFNFISVKKLGEFVIPFLPISEQKRIVEKIEEILPNIEKLEKYN